MNVVAGSQSREPIPRGSTTMAGATPERPTPSSPEETANTGENEIEMKRCELLKYLPLGTREFRYRGFRALEDAVNQDSDQSPYIVFTEVPHEVLDLHEEEFPGHIDFCVLSKTLILKKMSFPHEAVAGLFEMRLGAKVDKMNLAFGIKPRGSLRTKTPGREKQADRSYQPFHLPRRRSNKWPTVAVEIGFSETTAKLTRDMIWWLSESNGEVQLGITIDIKRPSGIIYIATWELGMVLVDGDPQPEPENLQSIKINPGKIGQQPRVTGGELVIPFQSLFLRNPGAGESDVIFSEEELLSLATSVWEEMEKPI